MSTSRLLKKLLLAQFGVENCFARESDQDAHLLACKLRSFSNFRLALYLTGILSAACSCLYPVQNLTNNNAFMP